MIFKVCYSCGWKLPLFLFPNNKRKFKIKSQHGKCFSCYICNMRKLNGVKFDFITNKFKIFNYKNIFRKLINK